MQKPLGLCCPSNAHVLAFLIIPGSSNAHYPCVLLMQEPCPRQLGQGEVARYILELEVILVVCLLPVMCSPSCWDLLQNK